MAKKIIQALHLSEISAVDRPAQAHARAAIIKRNQIRDLEVKEVSLVDRPANPGAKVLLVKRDATPEELRYVPLLLKSIASIYEDAALSKAEREEFLQETLDQYADATGRDGLNDIAAHTAIARHGLHGHPQDKWFAAKGPYTARLARLYDDHQRGNPGLAHAHYRAAWNALSDEEKAGVRREEEEAEQARLAEEAAQREAARNETDERIAMATREQMVKSLSVEFGAIKLAKHIVDNGNGPRGHAFTEAELTSVVKDYSDRNKRAGEGGAQAFARIITENSDEGMLLRKAYSVVKGYAAPAAEQQAPYPGNALAELRKRADEHRKRNPGLTREQAFARVYEDPANRELAMAERAQNRPRA